MLKLYATKTDSKIEHVVMEMNVKYQNFKFLNVHFIISVFKLCFKATHPVKDLKAFPKDNVLWVEWTAPNESVNKYVLEWCVLSDKLPCNPDWQQEDGTVHRTYLRGIPG